MKKIRHKKNAPKSNRIYDDEDKYCLLTSS